MFLKSANTFQNGRMKGPATGEEDSFARVEGGDSLSILSGSELSPVCSGMAEEIFKDLQRWTAL